MGSANNADRKYAILLKTLPDFTLDKKMLKRLSIFIFSLFPLLLITILNFKMPMLGEDFALSIPLAQHNLSLLEKMSIIFTKIYIHSIGWNARLGEQLAIFFLSFNKNFFNILNIFVTVIFLYLILTYAHGYFPKIELKTLFLLTICLSILLSLPMSGDILLWTSIVTNYLWSICILAIFFLPYRVWFSGKDILENKPKILHGLFIVLAVLAGMTNENTIIAVIVIIIAGYFLSKTNLIKMPQFPKWYWWNLGFLILGYSYLLLSPSTKMRREYYAEAYGITSQGIRYYITKIANIIIQYLNSSKLLLIILGILIVVLFILIKWNGLVTTQERKQNWIMLVLLWSTSFISVIALMAVPYFESRAVLLNWFFLFTLILNTIIEIINHKNSYMILLLPILILGMMNSMSIYNCTSELNVASIIRQYNILTQISNGSRVISVLRLPNFCPNIISDREDWLIQFNHDEIYYNVDNILLINP